MTGCESIKCELFKDGVCTEDGEYIDPEDGELCCPRRQGAVAIPKTQEWISVEDKLPEHNQDVLATYENQWGKNIFIIGIYLERWKEESTGDEAYDEHSEEKDEYFMHEGWYEQQDNWMDFAYIYVNNGKVSHWRPLPDPPKNLDDVLYTKEKFQKAREGLDK